VGIDKAHVGRKIDALALPTGGMWQAGPYEKAASIQETFADGRRYRELGLFRERLAPDYLLRLSQFLPEWMATLASLGKTGAFWRLGGG
jgi:hypothetical protein